MPMLLANGKGLLKATKRLLENVGTLEGKNPILTGFIDTLKSFDEVRKACFGQILDEDYEEKIQKFHNDYMVLVDEFGMSILVKAHEVFFHVVPWLKKWNIPLGVVSEQTSESLHSDFDSYIERKNVQNPNSPVYAENLLKVVVAYNSSHI